MSGRIPKEGPPPCVCSTGWRAESGGGQDLPDRASAYAVAEPGEFSVDSAMAPGGVLPGQVQHRSPNLLINRWAAWSVGVGLAPGDQAAVPGQQRGRVTIRC